MGRAIAVAQTTPVRGDVAANIDQHLRLVQLAADGQAQVVVFPELSLTGYELDLGDTLAFEEGDRRLEPLIDAAVTSSMTLVVGAPVRLDARLHIGALIVAPTRAVAIYTKHHLGEFSSSASGDGVVPPAERTFFQPGDRNPLVHFGGTTAAVAVCADTGRPSHPQQAADRGATTYLASMFVIPSELESDAANLSATAVRHSMAIAFANYGAPTGGLASAGTSAIWSPNGERVAVLEQAGAGVAVAREGSTGWRGTAAMLPGV
jgi:predicted amidohydrolase